MPVIKTGKKPIRFDVNVETNYEIIDAFSKFLKANQDSITSAGFDEYTGGAVRFYFQVQLFNLQVWENDKLDDEVKEVGKDYQ